MIHSNSPDVRIEAVTNSDGERKWKVSVPIPPTMYTEFRPIYYATYRQARADWPKAQGVFSVR